MNKYCIWDKSNIMAWKLKAKDITAINENEAIALYQASSGETNKELVATIVEEKKINIPSYDVYIAEMENCKDEFILNKRKEQNE